MMFFVNIQIAKIDLGRILCTLDSLFFHIIEEIFIID